MTSLNIKKGLTRIWIALSAMWVPYVLFYPMNKPFPFFGGGFLSRWKDIIFTIIVGWIVLWGLLGLLYITFKVCRWITRGFIDKKKE
jgi:hypothetical protein